MGVERELYGDGILHAVSKRRPQENLGPAIGRPQRGQYLGMGTSVRPANGAHRRSWGQPSGAYRWIIDSEGGYLSEASRQGAHRRRCGHPTAPTGHSEACHCGAHSVVS